MSQLEEIKARAEKATPGPWKVWGMQVLADPVGDSNLDTALPIADTADPHRGLRTFNADFIARARMDVPKLIAALEAVEAHHQPIPARAYDRSEIQICATCSDDTGNWEIYPCPTLTAITEALQ